jgi:sugar phosphate isomerase/epimerase
MLLGVFENLFKERPFEAALDYIAESGLDAVEMGCGRYPGKDHCNPEVLLSNPEALRDFRNAIASRGLRISALSCHGNPLHPNAEHSAADHTDFEHAVRLASELEVDTVITFSGCPGESEHSVNPVWVTTAWPEEHREVVAWQWEEKAIPYWTKQNEFLAANGVRAALEAHPGFLVYNTETMLRLREACGAQIGINFDPSHLVWQGLKPELFIRDFADRIYHTHMKDVQVRLDGRAGILGSFLPFGDRRRGWNFVSLGHGDVDFDAIIRELNAVGYSGPLSVEWEDNGMHREFGARESLEYIRRMNFSPSSQAFDGSIKK